MTKNKKLEQELEYMKSAYENLFILNGLIAHKIEETSKEIEILKRALELTVHELSLWEEEGIDRFEGSEETIKAEFIDKAKKETK